MSDLISRSALLEQLLESKDNGIIKAVIGLVESQPTAYDISKVVAELEEEAKDTCMEVECSRYRACCYCRGVKSSIDIVKRGGVE